MSQVEEERQRFGLADEEMVLHADSAETDEVTV